MEEESYFADMIKLSKKINYTFIDITHKNLSHIPDFTKSKYYSLIKNIKHLFAGNNNIENIEKKNFDQFPNLETIDLSFNKLKKLDYIPQDLNQLTINNNELIELPYIKNLRLLEASVNKLTFIPTYEKLKDLYIDTNNITELQTFPNITYITCRNNNIKKINPQPKLLHLNCSFNRLGEIEESKKIFGMPKLKNLYCSNNPDLCELDSTLKYLEIFEFVKTNINILPYISTLKHISCTYNEKTKNLIIPSDYYLKKYIPNDFTSSIAIEFR